MIMWTTILIFIQLFFRFFNQQQFGFTKTTQITFKPGNYTNVSTLRAVCSLKMLLDNSSHIWELSSRWLPRIGIIRKPPHLGAFYPHDWGYPFFMGPSLFWYLLVRRLKWSNKIQWPILTTYIRTKINWCVNGIIKNSIFITKQVGSDQKRNFIW